MVVAITQGSRSRGALRETPTKRLADVRPVLVPAKPRRTNAPMVLIDGVRGLLEFIPVSSIPSFMNCLRTASRADWSKLWLMNPITLFRIVDHFPVPDLWQQLHCLETCS